MANALRKSGISPVGVVPWGRMLTRGEFDRRRVSVHTDLPADLPRVRRCRWRRVRPAMTS
jgi:hypothetical protein